VDLHQNKDKRREKVRSEVQRFTFSCKNIVYRILKK